MPKSRSQKDAPTPKMPSTPMVGGKVTTKDALSRPTKKR